MSTKTNAEKLPKGLFLASFILLVWLALFAVVVRWNALPSLADLLPKETIAFWLVDMNDLKDSGVVAPAGLTNFLSSPVESLPWIESLGGAWLKNGDMTIVEVNSKSQAQEFLDSLKGAEENYNEISTSLSIWGTVYCYESSQPYCFTWVGDLLFVASNEELLSSVQSVAQGETSSLEESGKYQNVRGRLSHWNSGIYYFDLQEASARFMDDFGAAASLLELFPSMGGVLKYQVLESGKAYLSESFVSVDKSLLNDEAFYHPDAAYGQSLLPWTSEGLAWEWGGQNLYAQWQRMGEILASTSPATEMIWQEQSTAQLKKWFGSDFDYQTQLAPLLDKEQYFAFTPGGNFLFLDELEEGEAMQVDALKDKLAQNLNFKTEHTNDNGEVTAELQKATVEQVKNKGTVTYEFNVNGETKLTLVILNNALILSNSEELALSTLDKALGQADTRDLQELSGLLPGSDEVLILHCPLLPDGHILKTLGGGFESILSTRKLFDDGVFTRSYASMN